MTVAIVRALTETADRIDDAREGKRLALNLPPRRPSITSNQGPGFHEPSSGKENQLWGDPTSTNGSEMVNQHQTMERTNQRFFEVQLLI